LTCHVPLLNSKLYQEQKQERGIALELHLEKNEKNIQSKAIF
jgi:hypothetical protein